MSEDSAGELVIAENVAEEIARDPALLPLPVLPLLLLLLLLLLVLLLTLPIVYDDRRFWISSLRSSLVT